MLRHYDRGVATVVGLRHLRDGLRPLVNVERWTRTATVLAIQEREARWWRDASLAYRMSINGTLLPPGNVVPEKALE